MLIVKQKHYCHYDIYQLGRNSTHYLITKKDNKEEFSEITPCAEKCTFITLN